MLLVVVWAIHLEFQPPGIQMAGMDHHCTCTKEWWQMETDYRWLGRAYPKKLRPHGSFGSLVHKLEIDGLDHEGEVYMGYKGQVTSVIYFPLLGSQAIWQRRWFRVYKKGTEWNRVGLPFPKVCCLLSKDRVRILHKAHAHTLKVHVTSGWINLVRKITEFLQSRHLVYELW